MQSVGSSLQFAPSFLTSWFISYCHGLKCVLLSQCCSCSDCEGQKAQDPQCSSPGCQESKQLHFHHYSTSLAPHDAAIKVETSLFPNSITFSGREAVPSGGLREQVTTHQDIQEVYSICWVNLGNNGTLKKNNFDIQFSSLGQAGAEVSILFWAIAAF